MSDLVNLSINGNNVAARKGTLLVEAARQAGIDVPVFCYHPKLKPVGACRMCVVEIEKMPRLQTACTTPVAEGMVVRTASQLAVEGQQAVLEMLLANHPLDCPVCDKGGECPLQDNTFRYGGSASRMTEQKRAKAKAHALSDRIVLDRERCILCYRCTRFQEEIAGDGALVALERGGDSEIGTLDGESFESPFSGNTIELCPVGALTSRFYRFRSRPWDLEHVGSVCSGCSVGCNVTLDSRDGALLRVLARENSSIDDGWLCDRGRFATLPPVTARAHAGPDAKQKRALSPLLRRDGHLQRVPLAAAVQRAAELLRAPRAAVLLSSTLSNEALTLANDLPRALPGLTVGFAEPVSSPWPVTGRISNLAACQNVVDVGCDPWHSLPILALWLRKATVRGGTLVALGPTNGLFRDSKHWLRAADPAALLAATLDLVAALAGKTASPAATAAARDLRASGPAAVLLGSRYAGEPRLVRACQDLAAALQVDAATGFAGAPMPGANARGAAELCQGFARSDALAARPQVLATFGGSAPVLPPGARAIVATTGPVPDDASVEVVLPIAHPYETDGHYTNLEGVPQPLRRGGSAGTEVTMDHALLRQLLAALAAAPAVPTEARR